jgi:hypothetical protein
MGIGLTKSTMHTWPTRNQFIPPRRFLEIPIRGCSSANLRCTSVQSNERLDEYARSTRWPRCCVFDSKCTVPRRPKEHEWNSADNSAKLVDISVCYCRKSNTHFKRKLDIVWRGGDIRYFLTKLDLRLKIIDINTIRIEKNNIYN